MVRSKTKEALVSLFEQFSNQHISTFDFEGELSDAVAELFTTEASIAGISMRVIENTSCRLLRQEKIFLRQSLFTKAGKFVIPDGTEYEIAVEPKILDYAQKLEELRKLIVTIKSLD